MQGDWHLPIAEADEFYRYTLNPYEAKMKSKRPVPVPTPIIVTDFNASYRNGDDDIMPSAAYANGYLSPARRAAVETVLVHTPPSLEMIQSLAAKDREGAVDLLRGLFMGLLAERIGATADGPGLVWSAAVLHSTSHGGYTLSFKVTHVPLGVDSRPHVALCSALWQDTVTEYGFLLTDREYEKWQLDAVGDIDNTAFAKLFKKAAQRDGK